MRVRNANPYAVVRIDPPPELGPSGVGFKVLGFRVLGLGFRVLGFRV